METLPHPLVNNAVDLLMQVGKEFYPRISVFIKEANEWGVSKRIPIKSVPEGIVPGVSRMFLWHSEAIPVPGKGLLALVSALVENNLLADDMYHALGDDDWEPADAFLPDSYVPDNILRVAMALQDAPPGLRADLEERYEVTWQPGVFMYTVLGQLEYVVGKEETEMPQEVSRLGDIVKPVTVEYVDENGEPLAAQPKAETAKD